MKAKSKSAKKHIKKESTYFLGYFVSFVDLEQRMHAFYALFANFSFRNNVCGF